MEIRALKYLAAAVNTGNFGRAAKFLGVETSTISRRIARLEDELGLALFGKRSVAALLPLERADVLGRPWSGVFELSLWMTLRTTRRVSSGGSSC